MHYDFGMPQYFCLLQEERDQERAHFGIDVGRHRFPLFSSPLGPVTPPSRNSVDVEHVESAHYAVQVLERIRTLRC
jgi:hypothetical protein